MTDVFCDHAIVKKLEEAGFAALPATIAENFRNWTVRLSPGYPVKRLNSACPADFSTLDDLEDVLSTAARLYKRHNRPLIVRQTPLVPDGFEEWMISAGWHAFDESLVMMNNDPAPWQIEDVPVCQITDCQEWTEIFLKISAGERDGNDGMVNMLKAIEAESRMFTLEVSSRHVAAMRCVILDGLCGIFDLVTASGYRRSGFGKKILLAGLERATQCGARSAWLQVAADNIPAVQLYRKLGFETVYGYQYWRLAG